MLPEILTEAIASGEVRRPDGTACPLHGNVSEAEAQRLYDVVRAIRPEVSIEIGLAYGISALAIAQAVRDNGRGVHYVVDPFQDSEWQGVGVANLERAGLAECVRVHTVFPEEIVPLLPRAGFAFIDGSHVFDLALHDFVLVDRRLEIGGVIALHDLWMSSLQKMARYILTNRHYRVYEDGARRPVDQRYWKRRVLRLARRAPYAERIVRPEILSRMPDFGIQGSLNFIQKTAHDDRDSFFHREF